MRTYYEINLNDQSITARQLHVVEIAKADRYLIAKTLLVLGAATEDPLSPAIPLIFSPVPSVAIPCSNA